MKGGALRDDRRRRSIDCASVAALVVSTGWQIGCAAKAVNQFAEAGRFRRPVLATARFWAGMSQPDLVLSGMRWQSPFW